MLMLCFCLAAQGKQRPEDGELSLIQGVGFSQPTIVNETQALVVFPATSGSFSLPLSTSSGGFGINSEQITDLHLFY